MQRSRLPEYQRWPGRPTRSWGSRRLGESAGGYVSLKGQLALGGGSAELASTIRLGNPVRHQTATPQTTAMTSSKRAQAWGSRLSIQAAM